MTAVSALDQREPTYWWSREPQRERYWLEITDREEPGSNVWAPQRKDNGEPFWAFTLLTAIRPGDVVFHYRKQDKAIAGWSVASGELIEREVVWVGHGTSARTRGAKPRPRPGWLVPL